MLKIKRGYRNPSVQPPPGNSAQPKNTAAAEESKEVGIKAETVQDEKSSDNDPGKAASQPGSNC